MTVVLKVTKNAKVFVVYGFCVTHSTYPFEIKQHDKCRLFIVKLT